MNPWVHGCPLLQVIEQVILRALVRATSVASVKGVAAICLERFVQTIAIRVRCSMGCVVVCWLAIMYEYI